MLERKTTASYLGEIHQACTENPCVDGSIPPPGTISKPASDKHFRRFEPFRSTCKIPSKCPRCVPNCGRENLSVANSDQSQPKQK
jgi:hypothetical protein